MAKDLKITTIMRPAYELRAALAWSLAFVWSATLSLFLDFGADAKLSLIGLTLGMTLLRAWQARDIVSRQIALIGKPIELLKVDVLLDTIPKMGDNLWMGWGYRWQPSHTKLAYEVAMRDAKDIYPPLWVIKMATAAQRVLEPGRQIVTKTRDPVNERGWQWIHGLEPQEGDVMVSLDSLKGHCAIIATTGAIKTRLLALIIPQLVARGDTVIAIDPKGDKDLKDIMRKACERTGVPNKFMMLHPAFASQSCRLDMLKNWDRVSQVSSRVRMVLGSEDDSTFTEFCWVATHRITSGVKYIGRRVSLHELKKCMESRSAVEFLALEAMRLFFTRDVGGRLDVAIEAEVNKINASKAPAGNKKGNGIETAIPKLTAMIAVFNRDIPLDAKQAKFSDLPPRPEELQGLVLVLEAPREWFGKMIQTITPLLTKLSTDDLKDLLSPDYDDPTDTRPIMDIKRIVEGRHAFYVGTDALADSSVAKAKTAMILADAASVAAEIYNHGIEGDDGSQPRRIHLIVDEWGDAMCEPLIQEANKGRGAGMFIWALGQTFADLVVALGSKPAADRFMGNMNNLLVGAIQNPDTIKMVTEKFGETTIRLVEGESKSAGNKTEDTGMEFSSNSSLSSKDKPVPIVSPDLLTNIPDLQFFARLNRSNTYKGRIPVVVM